MLIDLKNLRQTLLAISVLVMGLPMLIALMGLFHVDWNFANFFGLPILIGAGHEYGVFMVHRYNEAHSDCHRRWRAWDVSDKALLLCGYVHQRQLRFLLAAGSSRRIEKPRSGDGARDGMHLSRDPLRASPAAAVETRPTIRNARRVRRFPVQELTLTSPSEET